ncbi:MAG: hypothetical protein RR754_01165, partial [Oscillospiraceae bacterium]
LRSGENTARLQYTAEIAKCSQAAKTQRANPVACGATAYNFSSPLKRQSKTWCKNSRASLRYSAVNPLIWVLY